MAKESSLSCYGDGKGWPKGNPFFPMASEFIGKGKSIVSAYGSAFAVEMSGTNAMDEALDKKSATSIGAQTKDAGAIEGR